MNPFGDRESEDDVVFRPDGFQQLIRLQHEITLQEGNVFGKTRFPLSGGGGGGGGSGGGGGDRGRRGGGNG